MTLPKSMKSALLTAAAFTSLVAGLTPNAVSAQTATLVPAPAIPKATETFVTKKLPLQNLVPETVLSLLHWNGGGTLPPGVKQITSLPKDNALLVVATPAGFTKTQEIIKAVDVAPRQVEVKLALASVPKTNLDAFGVNFVLVPESEPQGMPTNALLYLDGNIAAELLQTFTKQGRSVASPTVTTSSNVEASMSITGSQPTPVRPTLDSLTVTPHVNSDDTITIQLHMTISFAGIVKQHQQINTLRTIRSGGTLALCVSPPKPAGGNDHSLLLFITPTILGTQSSTTVTLH